MRFRFPSRSGSSFCLFFFDKSTTRLFFERGFYPLVVFALVEVRAFRNFERNFSKEIEGYLLN